VNAPKGGISIDLNAMDKVLAVYATDLVAVVQPGVTREALNNYLRDTGLFFPIDPGANASLGGMAATRASGTNAVRYGTMKDNVLALEAVMADGTVIRTGSRAKKSSAGYDLTRLLIGSEGTLGLITELTVKLHGIPEMIAGGICSFPSIEAACNAVIATTQYGIPVARIELLDAVQVRACNRYSGLSLPEETLLLLEFHGTENSVREQSEIFGEIAAEHTPHRFKWTTDPDERAQLWKARHDAFWAALAILPGGVSISTDVCVPISRLAECVEETRHDIEKTGLIAPIVGHVGDGNFHTLPIAMPDDDATWARIKAFSERLSERAIAMGGTCTGEHGIGQGKVDYLRQEMGPAVDVMMAVKQALDPNDILNPSKLFSK
jgi:D-lactate dehydrogenase (cytochrome)